jgi:bifunctional DNA-binding transcriptional regulator/antitoxin component of YhaV-PrlF toxin-antitoxin module
MNTTVRFIKTFSKGQITIPKEFRRTLGMSDEAWLKLYIDNGKIVAEPVEKKMMVKEEWRKTLLTLPSIEISMKEIQKGRNKVEKRLKNYDW